MKTKLQTKATGSYSVHLDLSDPKGRAIGMLVQLFESEATPAEEGASSWHTLAPGFWYGAHCQVTRDGQRYGASPRTQYFKTTAERQAYIDRRCADARKRYSREATGSRPELIARHVALTVQLHGEAQRADAEHVAQVMSTDALLSEISYMSAPRRADS